MVIPERPQLNKAANIAEPYPVNSMMIPIPLALADVSLSGARLRNCDYYGTLGISTSLCSVHMSDCASISLFFKMSPDGDIWTTPHSIDPRCMYKLCQMASGSERKPSSASYGGQFPVLLYASSPKKKNIKNVKS